MTNYEERQKDEILQQVHDLIESYDWGGKHEKIIITLTFKGKYWMSATSKTFDKKIGGVLLCR